jgi:hypothetical protein
MLKNNHIYFFIIGLLSTGNGLAENESRVANEVSRVTAPQLEEVLVTEGHTDIDYTTIDPKTEQLFSNAGTWGDPLGSVLSLPGVTFGSDTQSAPAVRGSAPEDNSYVIDTIPARYVFHMFGDSIFNENLIRTFDLYPAAFGNEYTNAIGAVIDVSLRDPKQEPFHATVDWSFLRASVLLESAIAENQAFYASYRRSLIDQFYPQDEVDEMEENEGLRVDSLPVSDDYQFKYLWRPDGNSRLSFVLAGASDDVDATFLNNSNFALRDPDALGAASIEEQFDSQGLIYNWISGDGESEFYTTLSHMDEKYRISWGTEQFWENDASRVVWKVGHNSRISDSHWLTMGGSVDRIDFTINLGAKIRPCDFFVPDCSTLEAERIYLATDLDIQARDLYFEDQWFVTGKLEFVSGFHYAYDNYLKERLVEPRLRSTYHLAGNWRVTAALGRYHQLPGLNEIVPAIGNPNLESRKATHYVLGLEHDLENEWSWKTEIYKKDMDDLALSLSADRDPDYADNYSNDASGQAYGLEIFINKNLTERWYGWLSLSLSETERKNKRTGEIRDFDYSRPVIFNLVGNYKIDDRWLFGFKWSIQSGLLYTPVIEERPNANFPDVMEPVYGELNSERLPTYHRLDLRVERKYVYSWGDWSWFVDLINAYNQTNIEGYEYAPNGYKIESSPPAGFGENVPVRAEEGLELFPSIGVKMTF